MVRHASCLGASASGIGVESMESTRSPNSVFGVHRASKSFGTSLFFQRGWSVSDTYSRVVRFWSPTGVRFKDSSGQWISAQPLDALRLRSQAHLNVRLSLYASLPVLSSYRRHNADRETNIAVWSVSALTHLIGNDPHRLPASEVHVQAKPSRNPNPE